MSTTDLGLPPEREVHQKGRHTGRWVILWIIVVLGVIALVLVSCTAQHDNKVRVEPVTQSPTASATPTPVAQCAATWNILPLSTADTTNNRWFYKGIAEIKSAKTNADATEAAGAWLEQVKHYPAYLVGASQVFLHKKADVAKLEKDGCATSEAATLYGELATTLAAAKLITPGNVDSSAYNSGVNNNTVVVSTTPGVYGDRKAIKIVLANGDTVWILARCGNLATPGQPSLPHGKTDNPKPPKKTLQPKGDYIDNGWTPGKVNTKTDPKTDGKVSQRQKASGQTEGNVIDNKVPANTKSDQTTPDHNKGDVTAPGATPGGDSSSSGPTDPYAPPSDGGTSGGSSGGSSGGTGGGTCVPDPFTGAGC